MNKTFSKILAGIAAITMTASVSAVNVFAQAATEPSSDTTQITFERSAQSYTYYQLFTGTWCEDEEGKIWLTDAEFGKDLDVDGLINFMKTNCADFINQLYLNRAIINGDYPANMSPEEVTINDVRDAVNSGSDSNKWETSEYNINNFKSCEDVLATLNIIREKYGEADVAADPHITGQYSKDSDRTKYITTGDKAILKVIGKNFKGSGVTVDTSKDTETTISVPNGYYMIIENDENNTYEAKINAEREKALNQLDYALNSGVLSQEKYDELKTMYNEKFDTALAEKRRADNNGAYTKINDTASITKIANGTIRVAPKISIPSVEKKIAENVKEIESTGSDLIGGYKDIKGVDKWNDAADYSIGDTVPFAVFGSMPENIRDYKHYYYRFEDRLGKGFDTPTNLKVEIGKVTDDIFEGTDITDKVEAKISDKNGVKTISIESKDILGLGDNINVDMDTVVMVTYSVKLNNNAVVGSLGNTNGVFLEYSTSIDYDGLGKNTPDDEEGRIKITTDKTVEDGVVAFTYEVDINKVDSSTLESLSGAVFTVQAMDGKHRGKYVTVGDNNKVSGWTDEATEENYLISDDEGNVIISGLDDGKYEVVEVKAPEKYHSLREPIHISLNANLNKNGTYVYCADDGRLAYEDFNKGEDEKATVDKENGIYAMSIGNSKGVVLPETGGEGVYALYGIGGLLSIGGTYFVTRRSKNKKKD